MHIFAISGSLRATSTNTALVRAIAAMAPDDMNFTIYDGLDSLPHFSPERDDDKSSLSVIHLREQLRASDGVLICTPEYAFGVPGSLKNALDWVVSTGEFTGMPTAAISASPSYMGGDKAHASLVLTLSALGAQVVEGGTLILPFIRKKMDAEGHVTDEETVQALHSVLDALRNAVLALKGQQ